MIGSNLATQKKTWHEAQIDDPRSAPATPRSGRLPTARSGSSRPRDMPESEFVAHCCTAADDVQKTAGAPIEQTCSSGSTSNSSQRTINTSAHDPLDGLLSATRKEFAVENSVQMARLFVELPQFKTADERKPTPRRPGRKERWPAGTVPRSSRNTARGQNLRDGEGVGVV